MTLKIPGKTPTSGCYRKKTIHAQPKFSTQKLSKSLALQWDVSMDVFILELYYMFDVVHNTK